MSFWRWGRRGWDFEREMNEELRDHVERQTAENVAAGMTAEEARRQAVLRFGGVEGVKETCREGRRGHWFDTVLQDVRYGARVLRKSPGFTVVAVLTLALGIGANTAIFSVVYGVLLRPLGYPHPERIVQLVRTYKGEVDAPRFDAREFEFWQGHKEVFQALAAETGDSLTLSGGSQPERVKVQRVSAEYFRVFGIRPALGREIFPAEDVAGGPNVAVISHGLWESRFGGDPKIEDEQVWLDGMAYDVIGVMPAGFQSVPPADLWTTIAPVNATVGIGGNYTVLGRLAPNVSREQAAAYFATLEGTFLHQFAPDIPAADLKDIALEAMPYATLLTTGFQAPLYILFGAIGLVLLIACGNVANLLLARAGTREREMAVRTAFGASRRRILRQLLTENVLLGVVGGALGLLLAYGGLHLLLGLAPADLPRVQDIRLDWRALAFTALISLGTGVLFGFAPAVQGSKTDVNHSLKEGAGQASLSAWRKRLGWGLAAGEIALSLVLLAGAALLIETFVNLVRTNPGFDAHPVFSMQVWTTGTRYNTARAAAEAYEGIARQIERVPGVRSAAAIAAGPPLEAGGNLPVTIAGQRQQAVLQSDYREITPGYFQTMGVRLLRGRSFHEADNAASDKVAIVNETFARRYLSGRDPLSQGVISPLLGPAALHIVGIAGDVRSQLDAAAPPTMFIPVAQAPDKIDQLFQGWYPVSIVVRAAARPAAVMRAAEEAMRRAAPELPIGEVRSMDEVLGTSVAFQRFLMALMSIFGGLAVALAAVGIYGVMSYGVAQRTREIGIRMALGAKRADVLRLVMSRGAAVAAIGVAMGIGGGFGLTRYLAAQLYGVKATDAATFAAAATLVLLIALVACYIPARRAARVDPMVALRHE